MTVLMLIAIAAFVLAIASALGKCPPWVAVLVLCVYALVQQLPRGGGG